MDSALTILHVDMDAFFAAIEQLDRPELRGRPVVVGAPPDKRGVVATCSYEARKFGIHSAMPSRTAGKLCPHAVFVPGRMERYAEVSGQVMAILAEFTPLVEQVSVDEAFLDVRGALHLWPDAVALARDLQRRIRTRLGLTASIGVAPNKYLAKVASDLQKPDGLTVVPVTEPEIMAFLAPLPVGKIWGIGKAAEAQLAKAGIRTIGQIQVLAESELQRLLGKAMARQAWELARGRDDRPVVTEWEAKSISNEHTFGEDCACYEVVRQRLLELTEEVGARLRDSGKLARTAQIKVRFGDFTTITRQCALPGPADSDRDLLACAFRLLERERIARPVRLIGFGVSSLVPPSAAGAGGQGLLFPELEQGKDRVRDRNLDRAVDTLRKSFGIHAVRRGNWPSPKRGVGPDRPRRA